MIYYICQPYSYDPADSFLKAIQYARLLRKKGLYVFSPILHTHHYSMFSDEEWEDYIQWDLRLLDELEDCVLVRCPGWENSKGCRTEVEFAKRRGIKIVDLEDLIYNVKEKIASGSSQLR